MKVISSVPISVVGQFAFDQNYQSAGIDTPRADHTALAAQHALVHFGIDTLVLAAAYERMGFPEVEVRKVPGGADRSYGIQVAKLAGVPESVIERAKVIAEELSANDITEVASSIMAENGSTPKKKTERLDEVDLTQMSLFDTVKDDDIIEELKEIDLGNLTPIDALNKLYQLQNKIKNRW